LKKEIKITCEGASSLPLDLIEDLQGNLKKISKDNLNKLKKLIITQGFSFPIYIWKNGDDNKIINGHQRRKALIELRDEGYEIPLIPIDYIYADNEKEALKKVLSSTAQYGEFDQEQLQEWIDQLDDGTAELLRFVNSEIALNLTESEETIDDDEVLEEVEPITKLGDLWELGNHRLLCGDSTDIENIIKLIDGNKIDFTFTDPPYGIQVVRSGSIEGSKPFGKGKNGFDSIVKAGEYEPIKGDDTIDAAISCYDISKALKIKTILLWGGNFYAHKLPPAKCFVVWDKETDGKFGDGEIAWCSANKSIRIFRHKWSGMIKASEHGQKRQHPTQKPVVLAEWALKEFMKDDELNVLDFFGGAGFTILAAEKINKISFICELSEHYCDVIVNRYIEWMKKNDREFKIKRNGEPFEYEQH